MTLGTIIISCFIAASLVYKNSVNSLISWVVALAFAVLFQSIAILILGFIDPYYRRKMEIKLAKRIQYLLNQVVDKEWDVWILRLESRQRQWMWKSWLRISQDQLAMDWVRNIYFFIIIILEYLLYKVLIYTVVKFNQVLMYIISFFWY